MLTVGWANRNSTASSPTVLGAVASECRMASRVGSAAALRRRATDSVRVRATTSPWPTPVPITTRFGNSRYMLEPKKRQGTNRTGWPVSTLETISGHRSRRMSHPAVMSVSNDRPCSNWATTWRPASSMTGSACCQVSFTGLQTSSRSARYVPSSSGDSLSLRKRSTKMSISSSRSDGISSVERDGRHGALDGAPQGVGVGLARGAGMVGEDLHLGEAHLFGPWAPEAADTIRQILSSVEQHLGQLRVPGLHRGTGGHREQPRQVAGQ